MSFYQLKNTKEEAKKDEYTSESDEYSDVVVLNSKIPEIDENNLAKQNSLPKLQVVLDIDKTLIFSSFIPRNGYDFKFNTLTPTGIKTVFVKKRLNLDDFLSSLAKIAEVSIFTAADRKYATQVIDNLDPERKIFSKFFYDNSCINPRKNLFIKDLSVVGFDMKRSVLVDDSYMSFNGKYENAIKVLPFEGYRNDNQLNIAFDIIKKLTKLKDVRPFLRELNMNNGFYNREFI